MSLDLTGIHSKKGRIIVCLGLFLLMNCEVVVSSTKVLKDQVQDNFGNKDVLSATFDLHKSELLGKAEWHFFEAQMFFELRTSHVDRHEAYVKAHESYVKAVNEFSEALGADSPMTCLVMTSQGRFETRFGEHKVAEDVLRRAVIGLEKRKADSKALVAAKRCLASTLEMQSKYCEAQQICEEALALARQSGSQTNCLGAMSELTDICFCAKNYDKAQQICEEALAITRRIPDVDQELVQSWLLWLSDAEIDAGHFAQAVKHCTEAINIAPNRFDAYQRRANAYRKLEDYGHAIDDFASAITRTKQATYHGIYYDRAKMFEKMGRYQDAIADYGQCIEPEGRSVVLRSASKSGGLIGAPVDYRLFILRGDDYQKVHQWQQAISDYSVVIESMKDSPCKDLAAVYEKRAKSYIALDKPDLAAADKLSALQAVHFPSELRLQ